jgi:UDP-N-acetyl-D-glucosamine dehydrogenase
VRNRRVSVPRVDFASSLAAKLAGREAVVAVIGLGFAGFPQAVEIAKSGLRVIGIDVDAGKIGRISAGESLSPDVPSTELQSLQSRGLFACSADYASVRDADIVVACLPTPLDSSQQPDLRFVRSAAEGLRGKVRAGQLLLLESTVPPGTTRKLFLPVLEDAGLKPGRDAFLAFAPERIDPGNKKFPLNKIPRLIGGITTECTGAAARFYEMFVDEVWPVSSPEVAEMSKNVENTFRFINISFINEVAMLCDRMGISVWEVVRAASTKPFAFMPHYPSPGVGGHCIPIVPFYLESVAREYGVPAAIIEAAGTINAAMPGFVVDKLERELVKRGKKLQDARVLVVGVTYKPDVPDLRESAAVRVLSQLLARGVRASYYDPYVPELLVDGHGLRSEPALDAAHADCAIVTTPHKALDYDGLASSSGFVFDTVNALPSNFPADVVKL